MKSISQQIREEARAILSGDDTLNKLIESEKFDSKAIKSMAQRMTEKVLHELTKVEPLTAFSNHTLYCADEMTTARYEANLYDMLGDAEIHEDACDVFGLMCRDLHNNFLNKIREEEGKKITIEAVKLVADVTVGHFEIYSEVKFLLADA